MGRSKPAVGRPSVRKERRKEVIMIALDLIAAKGLPNFQLRDVTDALGLSQGAIYRHFESRDEVIVEVQRFALVQLRDTLEKDREALAACLPPRTGSQAEALAYSLVGARRYILLGASMPAHQALISASLAPPEALTPTEIARGIVPELDSLMCYVAAQFEHAERANALRPGDNALRARAFWAALHGVAQTAKLDRLKPGWFPSPDTGLLVAASLLRGWGASSRALQKAEALTKPLHGMLANAPHV